MAHAISRGRSWHVSYFSRLLQDERESMPDECDDDGIMVSCKPHSQSTTTPSPSPNSTSNEAEIICFRRDPKRSCMRPPLLVQPSASLNWVPRPRLMALRDKFQKKNPFHLVPLLGNKKGCFPVVSVSVA